jgi:NNP family nitrate/nitrite transporter-like MFS transporter
VAVPVLLGSLARLPMGMLTDRFGGRLVFTALLAFSSLAAFVVPLTGSYGSLLVAAFLIGMAGSSFAVGAAVRVPLDAAGAAGHGPRRLRPGDDGAIAGGLRRPVVAARLAGSGVSRHRRAAPGWAVAYFLLARNPPQRPSRHVAAMAAVLRRAPTAWLLGAFYFLTFGGFVAFSIYLPTLLRAQFGWRPPTPDSARQGSSCSPR